MMMNRLFNIGKTSRIRMFNTMQMGCNRRWYGGEKKEEHSKIEEHPFTDGEAKPFGMEKTDPVDWNRRMYIIFYLGGIALFTFLYQYVPDTSMTTWGREEALKRMRARGVDLSWYEKAHEKD